MSRYFTFTKGGIHPDDSKLTADKPIKALPLPKQVVLMLSQGIGAPARSIVKPKDRVERGQLIAEASAFVSTNVHSPISGIVKKIEKVRNLQGYWEDAVIIESDPVTQDGEADMFPDASEFPELPAQEIENLKPTDITELVKDAGVVGLGGAAFPTHVKMSIPEGKSVDTVLINGAECEPYLTCDDVLMREKPDGIIRGTLLLMKAVGASKAVIGIENNKMKAYGIMKETAARYNNIEVKLLKKKYPQGSEKQLIKALTGKEVPNGGLPVDVGTLVDNVATAFAVYEAVYRRKPLIERVLTVTGPSIAAPGNYLAAIGTSVDNLISAGGGIPEDCDKVIAGGPMMGRAVSQTDSPSTKGLGALLMLPENISGRKQQEPCIRCGRCVDVCPMGLEPYLLMLLSTHKEWDEAARHDVLNCLECGCCSYICPASRPLLDWIKLSRQELRKQKSK